ncbi:RHS repeat-associated core domain protein, partial [Vibrio harveyi]
VVESYQYTPYGQVEGGSFSEQPFGYSTKRSDFASGLVYFGYRFYSPYQRRWLNRDPLQEQGGINLYAYVNGDPLGYIDPDGRNPVAAGAAGGAMVAGPPGAVAGAVVGATVGVAICALTNLCNFNEEAKSSKSEAKSQAKGCLPKPPTGKGKVPKEARDPKRFFTNKEREAKRKEQDNQCANGCGTDIDSSNSAGHHIERHADGGKSVPENHAEVCKNCHKDLHSGRK